MSLRRGVFAALIAALLRTTTLAWDAAGHMLVGQIAWEHTEPAARAKVDELVASLETTFNEGQPYHFITASCWMDDMRAKKDYAWSTWHYVTIPYTPSGSPCPLPAEGPNIVWAINENVKTLRDVAATPAQQTEALAMLMHFVGDLHQPMHCTDWNDRGGNGYLVAGITFSDLKAKRGHNLHTLWDKAFRFDGRDGAIVELWQSPDVAGRPRAAGEGIVAEEARKIMAAFPLASMPEIREADTPEEWARESHIIGCLAGYPPGPHPGNAGAVTLQADFVQRSYQLGQLRVALAGYRLAALLNDLFAK